MRLTTHSHIDFDRFEVRQAEYTKDHVHISFLNKDGFVEVGHFMSIKEAESLAFMIQGVVQDYLTALAEALISETAS